MSHQEEICDFGLHRGEPYSKLPASFLNWMIGMNHQRSYLAEIELQRRMDAVKVNHANALDN